jgi:hypothetical protein
MYLYSRFRFLDTTTLLLFKNKSKVYCLQWNHLIQLLYHLDTAIAVVFLIRESKECHCFLWAILKELYCLRDRICKPL